MEAMNRCIVPGQARERLAGDKTGTTRRDVQVLIVPQDHAMAMTDVDEAVWVCALETKYNWNKTG